VSRHSEVCVCVCARVCKCVCVAVCMEEGAGSCVYDMQDECDTREPSAVQCRHKATNIATQSTHTTTHAFQMMKQDTIDRRTLKHVKFFHKTSQSSNDAIAVWACAIGYGDGWPKHGLVTRAVNLLEGVVGSTVGPFQGVTKYDFEIGLFKDSLSSRSVVDQHTRPQVDASLLGFATIR